MGPPTLPTILCCLCGTPIQSNPSNMCINCIRSQVDITEGIPKVSSISYCRNCARYLQPPKNWVPAELESKELLTICIKRLKGLNKVKLVDAGFRWTEPHSRRIHLRLVVQKEVFNNTILQQEFIVEFVVEYQQCEMCTRDAAKMDEWQAVVQVRQKVEHKRTFLYLEQVILKHNAHADALGVRMQPDGIDFFFLSRSHALTFVSFLNHLIPVRHKTSDHLVSHDANSNTYRYKYTFSVEIAPLCKDDLACLPRKVSSLLGGIGPIVLVYRVGQSMYIIDPKTLQTAEISSAMYWKYPFEPLMSAKQAIEYTVLDVEPTNERNGKWLMGEATVTRSCDLGVNDNVSYIRTHLGGFLHAGDLALGYDIGNSVFNERIIAEYKNLELPDLLLFKRTWVKKNRAKKRAWKLKRIAMEVEDEAPISGKRGVDLFDLEERERETFLQDLEQDAELRSKINLYKDPTVGTRVVGKSGSMAGDDAEDDEYPEVSVAELLEDLTLDDNPDKQENGTDAKK